MSDKVLEELANAITALKQAAKALRVERKAPPSPEKRFSTAEDLPVMGFDTYEAGVMLGLIPKAAVRHSQEAVNGIKKVMSLIHTGRLGARNLGRHWRIYTPALIEHMATRDNSTAPATS